MSKILITGVCGFIASHIAERLVELGHEVIGVDNFSTGKEENIAAIRDKIEFHKIGIQYFDMADMGIDVICHQAASCNVPKSMKDPEGYFENNVIGTHELLMDARAYGIKKIIIASSSAAHDYISPYGISKRVIEQYSAFYNKTYDMNIVNLRYFNPYGPRQNMDSQHSMVIPIFINKLLKGEGPTIYGDGNQSRDFIYVDDVVDANVAAIENDYGVENYPNLGGAEYYDVGSGEATKIIDLFSKIQHYTGKNIQPLYEKERLGDPLKTKAEYFGTLPNWEPKTSLSEGLKKTIEWWKNE